MKRKSKPPQAGRGYDSYPYIGSTSILLKNKSIHPARSVWTYLWFVVVEESGGLLCSTILKCVVRLIRYALLMLRPKREGRLCFFFQK